MALGCRARFFYGCVACGGSWALQGHGWMQCYLARKPRRRKVRSVSEWARDGCGGNALQWSAECRFFVPVSLVWELDVSWTCADAVYLARLLRCKKARRISVRVRDGCGGSVLRWSAERGFLCVFRLCICAAEAGHFKGHGRMQCIWHGSRAEEKRVAVSVRCGL